jgi:hypothetical protein
MGVLFMKNIIGLKKKLTNLNGKSIYLCGVGLIDCLILFEKISVSIVDNKIILFSCDDNKKVFNEINVLIEDLEKWENRDDALILFFNKDCFIKIAV